ncbi:hypothetical protein HDU93_003381 [Gonapodya sp. JEL0774]|nr:hypothetical protein HDU93_003381 [Gonapodya sp. JEL0774]
MPLKRILASMKKATKFDFSDIRAGSLEGRRSIVSEILHTQDNFVEMLQVFANALKRKGGKKWVGTVKDIWQALKWFDEAAKSGDKIAKTKLGDCYHFGEHQPKVLLQAAKLYHDAAEVQLKLGVL